MSSFKTVVGLIEPVGGHGGMNYYDYSLSKGLAQSGVGVNWYTSDKTTEVSGSDIRVMKFFNGVYGDGGKLKRFIKFVIGLAVSVLHAKRSGCDVLHYHFFHYGVLEFIMVLFARIFTFPCVVTVHDVESFTNQSSGYFERYIFNKVDYFIVHNKVSHKALVAKRADIVNRVSVIPHGNYFLYVNSMDKVSAKRELGVTPSVVHFLFFGQIKKVKGLDVLLDAISKLKKIGVDNFQLTIAGKEWKDSFDKYYDFIKRENLSENIRCEIRYIKEEEVDLFYSSADVVVLPYKKIYQSGVLLMAMSYSKAVIVSDLEGMTEIVSHKETGLVFKNGDADSLVEGLKWCCENPKNLEVLGGSGADIMKGRFSWDLIGDKTKDIYDRVSV